MKSYYFFNTFLNVWKVCRQSGHASLHVEMHIYEGIARGPDLTSVSGSALGDLAKKNSCKE